MGWETFSSLPQVRGGGILEMAGRPTVDSILRSLVNAFRQEHKRMPNAILVPKKDLEWLLGKSARCCEDDNNKISYFYCHECYIPVTTRECLGALKISKRDFSECYGY